MILIAATSDSVDVEVSEFGSEFSSRIVKGVRGDMVVELERTKPR